MLKTVYEQIISRVGARAQEAPDARDELILEVARNGLRCLEGKDPVCWIGFNFPIEIPLALGYVPFYPEIAPGQLAGADSCSPLVDVAERKFSNLFCCSFHRCSMGAMSEGIWPQPAAIVGVSNVCDGQVKLLQLFGQMKGIKPIIVELPTEVSESAVDYVELQLKELIAELEELKGEKLDDEKLREVIRSSNRSQRGLMRINELRRQIPCPLHGTRALNSIYASMVQIWATPRIPQLYEQLAREIEEKGQIGEGKERFRLFLLVSYPTYKTLFFDCLEKEMGAIIVMDEMSNVYYWDELDEKNPVRSLAYKALRHPISGMIEKRVYWACKLAQDYKVDGAIHMSHWGCRQTTGGVGVLRESLAEIGIPLLNIDLDLIDSRAYSPGQLKTRLQSFAEMLGDRKGSAV